MRSTKPELRRQLRQTRLSLSDGERVLKSREIVERLKQLMDWSAAKTLHYFEPIHGLLEVDISDFITSLEDKYPDLKMSTPRLIGGTWELVSVRGNPAPDLFDVVIVPMLGFDPESLHRIGYGGGYYDKFLATQTQAKKIGVCFESGKTTSLPAEPHDVPMDTILTETACYKGR
jgi:5,10-methenyltetrahydrofolate synthetase